MLATDAKTQKIEPGPIFLLRRKFWRQCKHDWHNERLYLFFNVEILDENMGLSVQRP